MNTRTKLQLLVAAWLITTGALFVESTHFRSFNWLPIAAAERVAQGK